MIFLLILLFIVFVILGISLRQIYKLGTTILEIEDAVNEAMTACDVTYTNVSTLLDQPIAVLNPEVVNVIEQMKTVRDTVHYVSNVLAEPFGGIEETNENEEEEK
jgi:hypothetical protein